MRDRLRAVLREPFVQFLFGGLAIFAFFWARGTGVDPADRRITVTEAQVGRLAGLWAQTWRRQPTATEIDGMIRDHIKEEVYYREALRVGLDRDDPMIRRRLRSKMEFLATAQAEAESPTDAALQALLDWNPARYAVDPSYAFDQIYAGSGKAEAVALLGQIKAGRDAASLAKPLSVPSNMDAPKTEIARTFGDGFADALAALPKGQWAGPVESGFGQHIVRVKTIRAGAAPKLDDVRKRVENDWRAANRQTREARAYQALLDGYEIVIEKPR